MNKFFIDSSAWIDYFSGSEKGKKVKEIMSKQGVMIYTSGMTVAEVATKFIRENQPADQAVAAMQALASLVSFDFALGKNTALAYVHRRKTHGKFGLVDAHVLAAARQLQGKVVTCDADFLGLPEAIVIK